MRKGEELSSLWICTRSWVYFSHLDKHFFFFFDNFYLNIIDLVNFDQCVSLSLLSFCFGLNVGWRNISQQVLQILQAFIHCHEPNSACCPLFSSTVSCVFHLHAHYYVIPGKSGRFSYFDFRLHAFCENAQHLSAASLWDEVTMKTLLKEGFQMMHSALDGISRINMAWTSSF